VIRTVDVGEEIRIQGKGGDSPNVNPKGRVLTEFDGPLRRDFDLPSCFRSVAPGARRSEDYRKYVALVAMSKAAQAQRDMSLA
jgi:hypothetical protein